MQESTESTKWDPKFTRKECCLSKIETFYNLVDIYKYTIVAYNVHLYGYFKFYRLRFLDIFN